MSRRRPQHLQGTTSADLDELERTPCGHQQDTVLSYQVKLITPALLGGFSARSPDPDHPFREKAIRGHWRCWWRWMMRAGLLDDMGLEPIKPSTATPAERRDLENRVWGTVHGQQDASALPSRVALHMTSPQQLALEPCQTWKWVARANHPNGGRYEWLFTAEAAPLRYALSGAAAQKNPENPKHVPPRNLVSPGAHFELEVRVSAVSDAEGQWKLDKSTAGAVAKMLGYWAAFGGLGSRTRRGFGAFTLSPAHGTPAALPVELFSELAPQNRRQKPSWCFASGTADGQKLVGFVIQLIQSNPSAALTDALQQMNEFRQGRGIGRNAYQGQSLWHEADLGRIVAGRHTLHHDPLANPLRDCALPVQAVPRAAFGHFELRFAPKDVRADDQNPRDPAPRTVLPQVTDETGNLTVADRLPSSMLMRPLVWMDAKGQSQIGMLMAQFQHMAGANIPAMVFKPGGHGAAQSKAYPASKSAIHAAAPGEWARIKPLNHTACAAGVFTDPQDAAQAFMNFAYNRLRG